MRPGDERPAHSEPDALFRRQPGVDEVAAFQILLVLLRRSYLLGHVRVHRAWGVIEHFKPSDGSLLRRKYPDRYNGYFTVVMLKARRGFLAHTIYLERAKGMLDGHERVGPTEFARRLLLRIVCTIERKEAVAQQCGVLGDNNSCQINPIVGLN